MKLLLMLLDAEMSARSSNFVEISVNCFGRECIWCWRYR